MSADPPERNLAWAKALGLPFRLLSDVAPPGRVSASFGAWDDTWRLPARATFIIDRERRVRFAEAGGLAVDTGRSLAALTRLARPR